MPLYIFRNAERNKGLQDPVASQAVCRQRAAVLVELSSAPLGKAKVALRASALRFLLVTT